MEFIPLGTPTPNPLRVFAFIANNQSRPVLRASDVIHSQNTYLYKLLTVSGVHIVQREHLADAPWRTKLHITIEHLEDERVPIPQASYAIR